MQYSCKTARGITSDSSSEAAQYAAFRRFIELAGEQLRECASSLTNA
jgi:hypothetical protein